MITNIDFNKIYRITSPNGIKQIVHKCVNCHNDGMMYATTVHNGCAFIFNVDYFLANAEEYNNLIPLDVMMEFDAVTDMCGLHNYAYFDAFDCDEAEVECVYDSKAITNFICTANRVFNFLRWGDLENFKQAEKDIKDYISAEYPRLGK